eukprot:1016551-Alexandrium_andersonii.AAC.1
MEPLYRPSAPAQWIGCRASRRRRVMTPEAPPPWSRARGAPVRAIVRFIRQGGMRPFPPAFRAGQAQASQT